MDRGVVDLTSPWNRPCSSLLVGVLGACWYAWLSVGSQQKWSHSTVLGVLGDERAGQVCAGLGPESVGVQFALGVWWGCCGCDQPGLGVLRDTTWIVDYKCK